MSKILEELMTKRFRVAGQVIDRYRLGIGGPGVYSNGRSYRKPVTIGTGSANDTNFQVKVTVTFESGKMNADFSDIYFEDSSGNRLDYWIETYTASTTAQVWVEAPTISTSTAQTIYMYYGKGDATTESDIDSVMQAGLRAFLYDGTGFNTYLGTTVDTNVSHDWGGGTVSINGVGNQSNTCSVIWRGWVKPNGLGNTVFYGSSDDGQRLYLNGGLVINNWSDQGTTERSYTYNLQSVTAYEYQYYENGGGAVAKMGWDPVNAGKSYPIPSTYLRCRKYMSSEPSITVGSEETP